MKKAYAAAAALMALCLVLGFVAGRRTAPMRDGNHSNEMKMEYRTNFDDYGASAVERNGDHAASPYFYSMDFFNAEPTDSLFILPHFQTIQQTSWWSCGVSATEMVLNYFGARGDWDEESLSQLQKYKEYRYFQQCGHPYSNFS